MTRVAFTGLLELQEMGDAIGKRWHMALKKSDLYSSLWRSCDELRGGMDASQYKDYILTLLFMKYVSDKAKADPGQPDRRAQGRVVRRHARRQG